MAPHCTFRHLVKGPDFQRCRAARLHLSTSVCLLPLSPFPPPPCSSPVFPFLLVPFPCSAKSSPPAMYPPLPSSSEGLALINPFAHRLPELSLLLPAFPPPPSRSHRVTSPRGTGLETRRGLACSLGGLYFPWSGSLTPLPVSWAWCLHLRGGLVPVPAAV